MTDTQFKEFIDKLTKWYRRQHGACMCLGNCEHCGHHKCFGCACWIREEIDAK